LVAVLGVLWIATAALAAAANRIAIGVSSDPTVGMTYNITLRGTSHGPATAWMFLEYAGCAKSFAAERKSAPSASFVHYRVNGRFVRTSGWSSNSAVMDHACAYLVTKKSQKLLARARVSFTIHPKSHH
jgi:hypothetical protein